MKPNKALPLALVVLCVACHGGTETLPPTVIGKPAPAVLPSSSAKPPRRPPPVNAPPPAKAPPPKKEPLPKDGTYWVRTPVRGGWVSRGTSGHGGPIPNITKTRGHTECTLLRLEGGRRLHVLGYTFRLKAVEGGWSVHDPFLRSSRPFLLQGRCRHQTFTVRPADKQATHWASNAGPIFRNKASCMAVASTYVKRCQSGRCTYANANARPFELEGCKQTLTWLTTRSRLITAASHAQTLRTMRRLNRLTARGGRVWEYLPEKKGCHQVSVRPLSKQRVRLELRYRWSGGGRIKDIIVLRPRPLFNNAVVESHTTERRFPGGGTGLAGDSDQRYPQGLYLGDAVFVIGSHWYFFRRQTCEANPARYYARAAAID